VLLEVRVGFKPRYELAVRREDVPVTELAVADQSDRLVRPDVLELSRLAFGDNPPGQIVRKV
jgi:hypothetical protein